MKLDLSISPQSLLLFQRIIGSLCLYEFLVRIFYFEFYLGLQSFSPFRLILQYLQRTEQAGWSHLLFFVTDQSWYQYLLLFIGCLLSIFLILKKFSQWVPSALAFLWLNLCYRNAFLSHGGDAIIFFSLILLSIWGIRKHKVDFLFNALFFFQFSLILIFAGLNKLSAPWMDGSAIEWALRYDTFSGVSNLPEVVSPLLKWATWILPVFEILLPFLLIFKRSRQWGVFLLFAFGISLLLLFNSGILALSLLAYGFAFRQFKSDNPEIEFKEAQLRSGFAFFVLAYCLFGLLSSAINLRVNDQQEHFWTLPLKKLEREYYFGQNWSFMTNPISDFLTVKVTVSGSEEKSQTWVVKDWIQSWSNDSLLDFQMIHRRAIFFKHLFWMPDSAKDDIFGQSLCQKENFRGETLDVGLFLGSSKQVRSLKVICQ